MAEEGGDVHSLTEGCHGGNKVHESRSGQEATYSRLYLNKET